ncbi:MAG TPA: class I SAM-dependent methyltransferase [Anaerolineales bacterium]|nr:class I SAM-dependent methyltransferase [Anaerolineales bacterium]HNB35754.1 class I SAM-dependent methyltransferase [Anaerolineales bacterium]HNC07676.1 class I SAM-dependent methyltransferase [Anaerolineales bacterium]
MNLRYLLLRLIRHFMPEGLARFLLKRRWIIKPGLESTDPFAASQRYVETLAAQGISIQGRRVLVFGYGGRFAVGVDLLKRGAAHVILCDHFVLLDTERNRELLPDYVMYLKEEQAEVQPRGEFITLLHGDIREESIQRRITQADVILSTSVFEHLDDVPGITKALANLTAPGGSHLHFVDLRDHFFKYPFEMLKYSEHVWRNFLNPTSNLNRYRFNDYKRVFESNFVKVEFTVLERLMEEFHKAKDRIRPEFKTGKDDVDAVTLIHVVAREPYGAQRLQTLQMKIERRKEKR